MWLSWGLDLPPSGNRISSPPPPVLRAWEQAVGGTQLVYRSSAYREESADLQVEPQGPDTHRPAFCPAFWLQAALAPQNTGALSQGHEAVGELEL